MPPTATPLPNDVLIANVRRFLSNNPVNVFEAPVDAEGDGRMTNNCLEVIEGGPEGFEWTVETDEAGKTLVRVRHSASLLDAETGTWLTIPGGGVGTTADSLSCNAVPNRAYTRDNPSQ